MAGEFKLLGSLVTGDVIEDLIPPLLQTLEVLSEGDAAEEWEIEQVKKNMPDSLSYDDLDRLIDRLCSYAPEGYHFGTKKSDDLDYGFWKADDSNEESKGFVDQREVPTIGLDEIWQDPITGMEFVLVRGGWFQMGDFLDEFRHQCEHLHEAFVDDFYIGKYLVTQEQWTKLTDNMPSQSISGADYPVHNVSWEDIEDFVRELNQRTGYDCRLPTEAEWEYAARSGGKQEKWAGTNSISSLKAHAWYMRNSGFQIHPVGQKLPNGLGLYDMSGNVYEWVHDWFSEEYYKNSPHANPKGPRGPKKFMRGIRGGCVAESVECLVTFARASLHPNEAHKYLGFRLVYPAISQTLDTEALIKLLLKKGVFREEEYLDMLDLSRRQSQSHI